MSLAPTLKLERIVAIGVGAITAAGLAGSTDYDQLRPAQSALAASSLVPTLSIQSGPLLQPDPGAPILNQLAPSLLTTLKITTGLPDAVPEENDLSITIVWGGGAAPDVGALSAVTGRIPILIGNGELVGGASAGVGLATMDGLVPTISISPLEETAKSPLRATIETGALAPTLLLDALPVSLDVGLATVSGLAPNLGQYRVGWQTVTIAGVTIWTDVPPA